MSTTTPHPFRAPKRSAPSTRRRALLKPRSEIVLDIGDEDGRWIGCIGHVDRYEFMIAYAAHACDEYVEVGPSVPHPQHVYMVEFDESDCDETMTATWWQLDPVNPVADRITPITVLALDPGTGPVTERCVDVDGGVLAAAVGAAGDSTPLCSTDGDA